MAGGDDIAGLLVRPGLVAQPTLAGLQPGDDVRLAAMAGRVAAQVASLARPLPKDLEPAHAFRVVGAGTCAAASGGPGSPGEDKADPGAPT